MKIKNLLFDLGGVIVDIRRENCVEAFRALGMADPDSFLGEYSQKGPFLLLEEGKISAPEFRDEVRKLLSREATDEEIDRAFYRFLLGIPEHRLSELHELKEMGYGIFLLSNTNEIMWEGPLKHEFTKQGKDMDFYVDGVVTSFEAKSCKPDRKIFDEAVTDLGIKPEETLFLDDSQKNIEAARKLGFNAELVAPGMEFMDILKNKGLA